MDTGKAVKLVFQIWLPDVLIGVFHAKEPGGVPIPVFYCEECSEVNCNR